MEPKIAKDAVLQTSSHDFKNCVIVSGYDFNNGINYEEILKSFAKTGFQATNFAMAIEQIIKMLKLRDVPLSQDDQDLYEEDEFIKRKHNCTIFFGYTSDLISSGLEENIRFLVQHKLIDCLVTTSNDIEEDLIKCMTSSSFEHFLMPILDEMLQDQKDKESLWTPSKMIQKLGERIDCEESIYYWAAKNKIPVFCPAFTDGRLLGDMIYLHSFRNPGLVVDILEDLRRINKIAMKAKESGIIAVGGGVTKHHMMKANCIRDGADYCVFFNNINEFDGSDSGANPEESVAAGKIKPEATPVKVFCDATFLPLVISETFCKFKKM